MATTTFYSQRSTPRMGGFRFRGGQLVVPDDQADAVRELAARHPELCIVEAGSGEPAHGHMRKDVLIALADARGLDISGTKAALIERLAQADAEPEPEPNPEPEPEPEGKD